MSVLVVPSSGAIARAIGARFRAQRVGAVHEKARVKCKTAPRGAPFD